MVDKDCYNCLRARYCKWRDVNDDVNNDVNDDVNDDDNGDVNDGDRSLGPF